MRCDLISSCKTFYSDLEWDKIPQLSSAFGYGPIANNYVIAPQVSFDKMSTYLGIFLVF